MESGEDIITAIAGVFSGRRNPEVVLRGADAAQLAERLHAAVGRERSHPPPPPKLGVFYGFEVHTPAKLARELGVPENVNVFAGVVTDERGREQHHWRDTGGVEEYLLAKAWEQGHGELLEKVGAPRSPAAQY